MVQLAYFFLRCCLHRRPFLCTGTALSPTFPVQLLCFVVVAAAVVVVVVVVVVAAAAAAAVVAVVAAAVHRTHSYLYHLHCGHLPWPGGMRGAIK